MASESAGKSTPGDFDIDNMRSLAGIGVCPRFIAGSHHMELPEFLAQYGEAIARTKLETDVEVLRGFREMAISQKSWSATAMWIKLHCAYLFDTATESKSKSSREPEFDGKFRPIEFDVYCNDGEPNFDD